MGNNVEMKDCSVCDHSYFVTHNCRGAGKAPRYSQDPIARRQRYLEYKKAHEPVNPFTRVIRKLLKWGTSK